MLLVTNTGCFRIVRAVMKLDKVILSNTPMRRTDEGTYKSLEKT